MKHLELIPRFCCVASEVFPMRFSLGAVSLLSASSTVDEVAYDETRAIQHAKLAGAAYCNDSVPLSCGYKCFSAGVCGRLGGLLRRGLRGDPRLSSRVTDPRILQVGHACKAHTGFLQEFKHRAGSDCASLRLQRENREGDGLAAMSLDSHGHEFEVLYNSDMSRTGDEIWAKDFNARFSDRSLRVTRHRQLVAFKRAATHGL